MSQEGPSEEQIQQTSPEQSSPNTTAIQQFLNAEPPHQQVPTQASQEAQQPQGSSLAEDAQIDSSSRPAAATQSTTQGNAAQEQRERANVENDEIMQSILQVGGIFSKQSEEAGIKDNKQGGDEDEDLSSSDSDVCAERRVVQEKKNTEGGDGGCKSCNTCGGPSGQEEKVKRKQRRDKKKPE